MVLDDEIMDKVNENHLKTGGHCGLDPVRLGMELGVEWESLRASLNRLVADDKITARWSVNKKLIFKNDR